MDVWMTMAWIRWIFDLSDGLSRPAGALSPVSLSSMFSTEHYRLIRIGTCERDTLLKAYLSKVFSYAMCTFSKARYPHDLGNTVTHTGGRLCQKYTLHTEEHLTVVCLEQSLSSIWRYGFLFHVLRAECVRHCVT